MSMIMPSNCPICKGPLTNEFKSIHGDDSYLYKDCTSKLNHQIFIDSVRYNFNDVSFFCVRLNHVDILWNFEEEILTIDHLNHNNTSSNIGNRTSIPWIEPDINDIKSVCERVSKLVIFT